VRLSKEAAKRISATIKEQTQVKNLIHPDRAVRLTAMAVRRIVMEDMERQWKTR
jgi:predicted nucleotidyltransferase